jgi:hypothetical protein
MADVLDDQNEHDQNEHDQNEHDQSNKSNAQPEFIYKYD